MTDNPLAIHWFRQDLRLADNPAFSAAAAAGGVLPIYILDDDNAGECQLGGASRWWLHRSLEQLNQSLDGKLRVFHGPAEQVIAALCEALPNSQIYWNRCYEPWRIQRDRGIKAALTAQGIEVHSYNSALLWEPWEVLKADGTPYKVFTPYYRKGCLKAVEPREPLPVPAYRLAAPDALPNELSLPELGLIEPYFWQQPMEAHWSFGEEGAAERLQRFLAEGLSHYKEGRNFPAKPYVSKLSPYLHFGEISPHQIWHEAKRTHPADDNLDHFLSELGWREFSYYLLYHWPEICEKNWQAKFDRFPWDWAQAGEGADRLRRWQQGQTGFPIVDAGMRELWQTGQMHNRVRMIVGSFLVKNLLIHWRLGERWFHDCLVDADLAANCASWQWVAGCGADAAPYFRIFNPVTQGEKFDPAGEYVRRYVPELAKLSDKYLHKPWDAPASELLASGVSLGHSYPHPVVDLKASRERALAALQATKEAD